MVTHPSWTGSPGLHLRLSRFPAVTHPTADTHLWIFGCPVFRRSPSHRRPSPVLLDFFLRLYPLEVVTHPVPTCSPGLQAVTHPTADLTCGLHFRLSRFSAVTHPTADRARCCLTFCFDCLHFRRSPIQVPTWTGAVGAAGLHFRFSHFRGHPSHSVLLLDCTALGSKS